MSPYPKIPGVIRRVMISLVKTQPLSIPPRSRVPAGALTGCSRRLVLAVSMVGTVVDRNVVAGRKPATLQGGLQKGEVTPNTKNLLPGQCGSLVQPGKHKLCRASVAHVYCISCSRSLHVLGESVGISVVIGLRNLQGLFTPPSVDGGGAFLDHDDTEEVESAVAWRLTPRLMAVKLASPLPLLWLWTR